ncbi:MAG: hypothetical protein ABSH48_17935 [Verrucomicrobiota bacterium]
MKIKLREITSLVIVAAALATGPAISRGADPTNPPVNATPVHPHGMPFRGKVVAVDTNAMTFTAGATTFTISSTTKIVKNAKPAVLADINAGETVFVFYKKDDDGKATAISVRVAPPKREAPPAPPAAPAAPAPATGQQ